MTNDNMDITPQIHHYLTTAPTSHFLQQEVQMLAHWSGRDNLLWRVACGGQESAVKLFLDAGQARGRRQFDGQERFAPVGIAPHPLWFDRYPEGLSRQVLVYRWVPGEPVNPSIADQRVMLAHSIAQMHGGDPNAVRRFCPNPVNLDYWWRVVRGSVAPIQGWLGQRAASTLLATFDRLTAKAGDLVATALPLWANTPPAPVHGDLRLENIINAWGTAVLLDWELFGLGDPALEVASFLHLSQAELGEDGKAEWLDAYLARFDQPRLAQRIDVYRHLLPFQSVCFLLDGWRDYLHSSQPVSEPAANLSFLAATLRATIQQAARSLSVEVAVLQVQAEIQALFHA